MALSIDKIMQAGFGLTGKGESFVKLNNTPAKKYNAERFAEAYAALRADEHAQVAEAALMRIEVIKMKSRGEADNKILDKVKNAGKDIWRTVKALIGKVIIIVEEFIAKLTSKVKPARKVAEQLDDIITKIDGNEFKENVKQISFTLYGVSANVTTVKSTFQSDLAALKKSSAFLQVMADATKDKSSAQRKYGKVYEATKKAGANTIKTGATPVSVNSGNDLIDTAINLGNTLEELEDKLAQLKKENVNDMKHSDVKSSMLRNTNGDKKTGSGTGVENFIRVLKTTSTTLKDMADEVEKTNTVMNYIKSFLNRLKNAPTSVTNGSSAEEMQLVRLMCTRANKALNINRQISNIKLARVIKIGGGLVKSGKAALKGFDVKTDKYGNTVQVKRD